MRNLQEAGHIRTEDEGEAAAFLARELGGDEVDEVHVHLDDRGDVMVLGDSVRVVCSVNEDTLVAKAVHAMYAPYLEREKLISMARRAIWDIRGYERGLDEEAKGQREDLNELLSELSQFEAVGKVVETERRTKRNFIEDWQKALRTMRTGIEAEARSSRYDRVSEEADFLVFTLRQAPKEGSVWEEDTPLAVRATEKDRLIAVGTLVEVRGRDVVVARERYRLREADLRVPRTGELTVNVIEALTAVRRQQWAVEAFLTDQMVNSRLPGVIVDPGRATWKVQPSLTFFQDWLSEDKKAAVNQAVSANELFLIQGPPGTGKTSVIAEIVLQVLARDPGARILLTSQSNVAVDHALAQIAKASKGKVPNMVRIGRTEKIAQDGDQWTLRGRTQRWRKEVLKRCGIVDERLRATERDHRRAMRTSDTDEVTAGRKTDLEAWMAEARGIEEQLATFVDEYEALGAGASARSREDVGQVVDETRKELREHVDLMNDLLPRRVDVSGMVAEEALAAVASVVARLEDKGDETRDELSGKLATIQTRRAILKDWVNVAGLTPDFEELVGRSARVVAATCSTSARLSRRGPGESFDWAIVDEAGRATVPEVLIPMAAAERVVLVGDERQLPPMVDEKAGSAARSEDERRSLSTSLFQDLLEHGEGNGEHVAGLWTQYRMHPAIGRLVSEVFYEGRVVNGIKDAERKRARWNALPGVVNWISTSGTGKRRESRNGGSYANSGEVDVVIRLLNRLEDGARRDGKRLDVGVITGYSAQVALIGGRLGKNATNHQWPHLTVEVATVDSFQGRECDIVIYSTVRSNKERRIGFLRDYRRINVALSRARELLVIVGDDEMMEHASIGGARNPFSDVLQYMRANAGDCAIVSASVVV